MWKIHFDLQAASFNKNKATAFAFQFTTALPSLLVSECNDSGEIADVAYTVYACRPHNECVRSNRIEQSKHQLHSGSCALVRGRSFFVRHHHRNLAQSAGQDCRKGAVVGVRCSAILVLALPFHFRSARNKVTQHLSTKVSEGAPARVRLQASRFRAKQRRGNALEPEVPLQAQCLEVAQRAQLLTQAQHRLLIAGRAPWRYSRVPLQGQHQLCEPCTRSMQALTHARTQL
jgi:hypothetical protein